MARVEYLSFISWHTQVAEDYHYHLTRWSLPVIVSGMLQFPLDLLARLTNLRASARDRVEKCKKSIYSFASVVDRRSSLSLSLKIAFMLELEKLPRWDPASLCKQQACFATQRVKLSQRSTACDANFHFSKAALSDCWPNTLLSFILECIFHLFSFFPSDTSLLIRLLKIALLAQSERAHLGFMLCVVSLLAFPVVGFSMSSQVSIAVIKKERKLRLLILFYFSLHFFCLALLIIASHRRVHGDRLLAPCRSPHGLPSSTFGAFVCKLQEN